MFLNIIDKFPFITDQRVLLVFTDLLVGPSFKKAIEPFTKWSASRVIQSFHGYTKNLLKSPADIFVANDGLALLSLHV